MTFVGIDNGVTGSISILNDGGQCVLHVPMPTKSEQSYTKAKQNITRIDVVALKDLLFQYEYRPTCNFFTLIERPMVNPGRFKASASALRALEATLIVLEDLSIPYRYIDSKEWQKALLPAGCEKDELKSAAVDIARRLFPGVKTKDADSLLIAHWARMQYKK